tara:strand:+ start:1141 stop:2253 length:1113 start_codon:yes stop_codon:yes gene_type:complete
MLRFLNFDIKKFLLLGFLFLLINQVSAQSTDSLTYSHRLNSGDYFPHIDLSNSEVTFPLEVQVHLDVIELREIDLKRSDFYSSLYTSLSFEVDTAILDRNNDTIQLYDYSSGGFDLIRMQYPEHDKVYKGAIGKGMYYSLSREDTLVEWDIYYEFQLPHKWDLRDYPFDVQKLKYIYDSSIDTSVLKMVASVDNPSTAPDSNFLFIQDGLQVTGIESESRYIKGFVRDEFIEGARSEIYQRLIFNVNVERKGSYLYFKLFFGGFLSFLISYLAFLISPKLFETRITLNIGGIFGAVSNKYVVENTMPAIQVLTKADIINNLVIVFIILNIFIVIGQQSKTLPLGPFERNKFAAVFIMLAFVFINLFIAFI